MNNRRYPPASLRYLKARLMNLARPSFWGTAIFLSVVGLLIYEYWGNPDIFGARKNTVDNSSDPLSSSLSPEDRAIAADIDNLPLLLGANDPVILPTPLTTNSGENKDNNSVLDALTKQKSSAQKSTPIPNNFNTVNTPENQNIFVSQTENILRFGTTKNQLLGLQTANPSAESTTNSARIGTGLVNQSTQNQNTNSVNNSSTSVYSTDNQNTSNNRTNSSTANSLNSDYYERLVQTAPHITAPTTYIRPGGYNNFNNNQPSVSSSTVINPPTNYLQPIPVNQPGVYNTLNSQPLPYSTGLNGRATYIQPTTTNIQPGYYNNYNNQVVPNQVPATTPTITGTSPVIGPYTIRSPRPNNVINNAQLVPSSYGNSIWQQPTNQPPQPNFPYTNQTQGQYINRVPNNGY